MKRIILTLAVVAVASCAQEVVKNDVLNVVPYPNDVQLSEGVFDAKGAAVTLDEAIEESAVNVIKAFAEKLSAVTVVESAVSTGSAENGFVFVNIVYKCKF